jgi:hypothetical protein
MFAYVVWFFIYVDFQKCGFSRSACVNLMDLLGYTYRNTEYDFTYLRIVKMNHEDDIVGKIYSYFFSIFALVFLDGIWPSWELTLPTSVNKAIT